MQLVDLIKETGVVYQTSITVLSDGTLPGLNIRGAGDEEPVLFYNTDLPVSRIPVARP